VAVYVKLNSMELIGKIAKFIYVSIIQIKIGCPNLMYVGDIKVFKAAKGHAIHRRMTKCHCEGGCSGIPAIRNPSITCSSWAEFL